LNLLFYEVNKFLSFLNIVYCLNNRVVLNLIFLAICRTEFQLSLNYGKTYIDSAPSTKLSELGIVNGDILTLNILPNGADEHSPIAAPTNRFSYPKSVEQTLIADSLPETSRDTAGSSTNVIRSCFNIHDDNLYYTVYNLIFIRT